MISEIRGQDFVVQWVQVRLAYKHSQATCIIVIAIGLRYIVVYAIIQSSYAYEGCLPVGDIEYIVELVDNTGEVVEQRVITSDSCSNGTCSILIPPSGTCLVRVQATSPFGNSTNTVPITGVPGKMPLYFSILLLSHAAVKIGCSGVEGDVRASTCLTVLNFTFIVLLVLGYSDF